MVRSGLGLAARQPVGTEMDRKLKEMATVMDDRGGILGLSLLDDHSH